MIANENTYLAIQKDPIDINTAMQFVSNPSHGGSALFKGSIRNFNLGRQVVAVEYDIFEPLALKTFHSAYEYTKATWDETIKVVMIHRHGLVKVAEMSVLVIASSIHRDEAFKACRYLIESIKHKSPIWKRENYIDGSSEWVQGHALCGKQSVYTS